MCLILFSYQMHPLYPLVFFAVPAIIGGGILYGFFHSYAPVFVYEIILILVAGGFASK